MLKITQKYYRSVIGFFFIFVISVSMLFFGMDLGGPAQDNFAIRVDETEIPFSEVYQRRREFQEQLRQTFGPNYLQIARQYLEDMNQRVVDNLVSEVVLLQFASELGLTAGVRQVQKGIQEMFGADFSIDLYDAFLRQRGLSARQFEARMQKEMLLDQFQAIIADASVISNREALGMHRAMLTSYNIEALEISPDAAAESLPEIDEEELNEFYQRNAIDYQRSERIRYTYVMLNPSDFLDLVEVLEDDIELHYTDHMNRYRVPDEVLVRQIELEIPEGNQPAERAGVRAFAEELIERINSGTDIGELAGQYSDDEESKAMAGQVGWVKRGERFQEYERAVFSQTDGGLAPLIEGPDAFYIVSIDDYKPVKYRELSEVRAEIEAEIRKREAPAYTAVKAADLYEQWLESGKSLEEFAGTVSLVANETSDFLEQREDPDGGRGLTRRVIEAPELEKQLVDLGSGSALVAVKEYQESDVPPLDQIRDQVVLDFRQEQARQSVRMMAQEGLEQLRSGEASSVSELAEQYKLFSETLSDLSRRSPGQLLSQSSIMSEDVFSADQSLVLTDRYYQVGDSYYLIEVKEISSPEPEDLTDSIDQYRDEASQRMASVLFSSLIESKKIEADININQSVYSN